MMTPIGPDLPVEPGGLSVPEIADLVGRDDPVILEIGANNGHHSRLFLDAFPRCRLFCFEPDHRAAKLWRATVVDPRAVLTECAVGAIDDMVPFHMSAGMEDREPEGWNQSGSLRAPKRHIAAYPWVTFPRVVEVQCTRLDTWLEWSDLDRIDFIWMDVQGAERDVFAGGPRAISMTPWLYTEYSNQELYEGQADLIELCRVLAGFDLTRCYINDALFKAKGRGRVSQAIAHLKRSLRG